jgi:hypothetical protein
MVNSQPRMTGLCLYGSKGVVDVVWISQLPEAVVQ